MLRASNDFADLWGRKWHDQCIGWTVTWLTYGLGDDVINVWDGK